MCGIVGAVAERDVVSILMEGLRRLEYRGYDSAGLVALDRDHGLGRRRAVGKVAALAERLEDEPLTGHVGIAHTRWATHGAPSEANAHPHICEGRVAVVHNGIIENHAELRRQQEADGYRFTSQTDTEVIAHQVHRHLAVCNDLAEAVRRTTADLEGAYALGVVSADEPGRLVAARRGSPLVIGVGIGEHFIASDVAALLPVTRRFVYLEEGDLADITRESYRLFDVEGHAVSRPEQESSLSPGAVERGNYRHFMLKEIFEQPRAVADTLEGRLAGGRVLEEAFGYGAAEVLDGVREVQILACGTSYHAGMVARYWLEAVAGVPCSVEVASEFRYRRPVVRPDTLVVTISQSGETADTLAALRDIKARVGSRALAICNVPESSLVRESELVLMTRAGPEIGVASTKAFTTQLTALLLLTLALARRNGLPAEREAEYVAALEELPRRIERALELNDAIDALAADFADKHHSLFLGRGPLYPVAMEGALKLKEISYIHAEAYPAGELKHGPLALVDGEMPVIAIAPNDDLLEKLKSNLQEVRARGGRLVVFADTAAGMDDGEGVRTFPLEHTHELIAPVVYTVPLQLLAYHVAVIKGTDVDQPRNLAKSVTVE
jgi:glucosamine--fructose-6-phosphate aminotransferase (isomerizing)